MKLVKCALGVILLAASSQAATVIVSQGFGATQGLVVTNQGVALASFTIAVGTYSAGTFSVFGSAITDTGKVNAAGIGATGPSSFNSQIINLFVGNGPVNDPATQYVVLRTNANTAFPADVSGTGSSTFNAALGSGLTLVANTPNAQWSPTATASAGGTINFVPEPSAALLGAIGALGLLRRRRI